MFIRYFKSQKQAKGFTLAELLIALAILGVIATFTIPKILVSSKNGKYTAIAKEAAASMAGAYQKLQQAGSVSSGTTPGALTQYLNYVAVDTSTVIDSTYGATTITCGGVNGCVRLHNGAMLLLGNWATFGGTNTTNAITFFVDPNGASDGTTNNPDKSEQFWLYYNGKISTEEEMDPNTANSGGPLGGAQPGAAAPWFQWSP